MKEITELVFILDRSGSMAGLESDTVGGFNSMLEKQRRDGGEVLVTTVLFDDRAETVHDRLPIAAVPKLTEEQYYVRGCTALLDAVGETISRIALVHRYARPEDRPGKTVFVITTDGMENASRRWSYEQIQRRISHEREKYGWEFLFLGANIDAAGEARRLGIDERRAVRYKCDSRGTALNYKAMADFTSAVRANAAPAELDACLAPIRKDTASRGF